MRASHDEIIDLFILWSQLLVSTSLRSGLATLSALREVNHRKADETMTMTARARSYDRETSHLAAESVTGITELQTRILHTFDAFGAMTDEELIARYKQMWGVRNPATDSSLRTRRCDLVTKGELRDSGITRKTNAGRKSTVWTINGRLL